MRRYRQKLHLWCILCGSNEGHAARGCYIYHTVGQIRKRLKQLKLCIACSCKENAHGESCQSEDIHRLNNEDICRRCGSSEHVFWTCDGKPHPGSQFRHGYIDSPLRNKSISTTPPKERDNSIVKEEKMFEMFNILLKKVENIETKLDFQESELESRSEPEVKNDDKLDSLENSTLQQEIFHKEVIINELRSQNNDLNERMASLEMKTSQMEKIFK